MSAILTYTLDDYSKILDDGFNYKLDPEIIKIIQDISEKVGAEDYIRTPQFHKNSKMRKKSTRPNQDISDEDWESIRVFQATEIKKKEGIEASIDKIRVYLNKITDTTFNTHKEYIFKEIENIINSTGDGSTASAGGANAFEQKEQLDRISEAIFTIASNNRFYSNIYAELYNSLITNYEFIRETLNKRLIHFPELFDDIQWCDPHLDYDKYCDINKENESRRALTLFYVNLMKRNIIDKNIIIDLINKIQKQLLKEINEENKKEIVEELSEIVSVLVINTFTPESCWDFIKQNNWIIHWKENYHNIYDNVCEFASKKTKNYTSLSNKSIFKHMDIRDSLNNLISKVN